MGYPNGRATLFLSVSLTGLRSVFHSRISFSENEKSDKLISLCPESFCSFRFQLFALFFANSESFDYCILSTILNIEFHMYTLKKKCQPTCFSLAPRSDGTWSSLLVDNEIRRRKWNTWYSLWNWSVNHVRMNKQLIQFIINICDVGDLVNCIRYPINRFVIAR